MRSTRSRIDGKPHLRTWTSTGMLHLLIGGGFDTTTGLTAHSLEWLSNHPDERDRLSRERDDLLDPATEEFLRFYTPAPGDGRTIAEDIEIDGVQLKEGRAAVALLGDGQPRPRGCSPILNEIAPRPER